MRVSYIGLFALSSVHSSDFLFYDAFQILQVLKHTIYLVSRIQIGSSPLTIIWTNFIGNAFPHSLHSKPSEIYQSLPGRYLKRFVPGFSFLVFGSWALLVRALLVLGIAGPEGFRLTRLL